MAEDETDQPVQQGAEQDEHDHPTTTTGDYAAKGPEGALQDMAGPGRTGQEKKAISPEVKEGLTDKGPPDSGGT